MRLLFWLALIVLVFFALKSKIKITTHTSHSARQPRADSSDPQAEAMLCCAVCQVHFPASEALFDEQKTAFCCEQHRKQYLAAK